MTQLTKIFSFLLKNPKSTPKEIAESLKFPRASVRRALHNLRHNELVSKPRPDKTSSVLKTEKSEKFASEIGLGLTPTVPRKKKAKKGFRYILNTVMYCSSKPQTKKATTYSRERFDNAGIRNLMIEMTMQIEAETNQICSEIAYDSGLDISEVDRVPFVYPEIRTAQFVKLSERDLELGRW